jgi:hypothetical protein
LRVETPWTLAGTLRAHVILLGRHAPASSDAGSEDNDRANVRVSIVSACRSRSSITKRW